MPKVIARLGDDVSTDVIYPGRYMATVLPTETPQFAFANDPELNKMLRGTDLPSGAVIAAGKNFGCGSSREQAVSTLAGPGVTIVAQGIARIFLQNAINLGLKVVIAPGVDASAGDDVEITGAEVRNVTSGRSFPITPLPRARQAILDAGGLIAYTRRRLVETAAR
jgi:3-isopropylmalate/(R)-2-methylmalate dehydratase small subunit